MYSLHFSRSACSQAATLATHDDTRSSGSKISAAGLNAGRLRILEAADPLPPRDGSAKGSEGDDASQDGQEAQEAQHPIRLLVGAAFIVFTVVWRAAKGNRR
jgi:hypothetical protein